MAKHLTELHELARLEGHPLAERLREYDVDWFDRPELAELDASRIYPRVRVRRLA